MVLHGLLSTVMSPLAMTLNFVLLTRKPNQYVSRSRYICELILVKLAPIVTKIHPVFCGPLLAVTVTFDLSTPNSNPHIYEPKYICDQNWVQFPSLGFEIWCSQRFGTHRLTDGRTHPKTVFLQHRRFFGREGIKTEMFPLIWLTRYQSRPIETPHSPHRRGVYVIGSSK